MEKIWLRAGLDLKMITYNCVATGSDQGEPPPAHHCHASVRLYPPLTPPTAPPPGMLEMVSEAETLRSIQVAHGLTGSFKDKPLAEWLQRHNPTDSAYRKVGGQGVWLPQV